jgi:acyl-CoA synthetase (NDP forming)
VSGGDTVHDTIQGLLSPKSIALYGIPRGLKPGKVFLLGLLDQGFPGPIYLIHPTAQEIDGIKTYPDLDQVPGPVDLVIIMSPKETVFDALTECARKQVRAVILYTSGFSELGEAAGRDDEARMRQIAHGGGFRLLGPNCMGIYSPLSRIAPFPGMPKTPGKIGFISQSGSLVNLFVNLCSAEGLFFSHVVSSGNSADIGLADLLAWMGRDEQTGVICTYCEGVRDSGRLLDALRETTPKKPVIMWKVGLTGAGSRAAASHTGALTGPGDLWRSLFRQFNILDVCDIEEMCDLAMAFYNLGPGGSGRVAIVSGPGGPAVSAADAVERNGLVMAVPGKESIRRLKELLPPTGTSTANPIDVGLSASFDLRLYQGALEIILDDPGVDAVVMLGGGASSDMSADYIQGLIRAKERSDKHVIAIAYPGFVQIDQENLLKPLHEHGIPVYSTPERALRAYARMSAYYRYQVSWG